MKEDFEVWVKSIIKSPKLFGVWAGIKWEYGYTPINQMWLAYQAGYKKGCSDS